ncbi:MAG TPA: hypothetical protein VFQ30_11410 [Ktedonobacteraceae bacterium]|nr:hypothetical protein [Ktedonobacteraceae bacterium]
MPAADSEASRQSDAIVTNTPVAARLAAGDHQGRPYDLPSDISI